MDWRHILKSGKFKLGNLKSGNLESELKRRALNSMALERITLAQAVSYSLSGCNVYENISEFDPAFAQHMSRDIYSARVANVEAIDLVRLDTATVHPSADHIVTVGSHVIDEQAPPWYGPFSVAAVTAGWPVEEIKAEAVIVTRFGVGVWGHWLGELLPKIVMVEATFPGRFRFVVPQTWDEPQFRSFRDSIQAYGVSSDRLVLVEAGKSYKLTQPWAVTPIWSDHVMHPTAAELMRCALPQKPIEKGRKVALFRQQGATRTLVNWDQIAEILSAEGFEIVDIATLDFIRQVQLFREAFAIFSTLGSGLTGLIYSPVGVRMLSVAPHLFGDRFFYALVVDRRGKYADVRGSIVTPDSSIPHKGSFSIDVDRVASGLAALGLHAC